MFEVGLGSLEMTWTFRNVNTDGKWVNQAPLSLRCSCQWVGRFDQQSSEGTLSFSKFCYFQPTVAVDIAGENYLTHERCAFKQNVADMTLEDDASVTLAGARFQAALRRGVGSLSSQQWTHARVEFLIKLNHILSMVEVRLTLPHLALFAIQMLFSVRFRGPLWLKRSISFLHRVVSPIRE
jgi:hypothetical protein